MSAQVFFKRHMLVETIKDGRIWWEGRQADKTRPAPSGYQYSRVPSSNYTTADNWYDVVQTFKKTSLNRGSRPTHYSVAKHPNGALRIMCWWFYAYQYPCNPTDIGKSGAHFGDWERVMVTTTPDRTQVESTTYWQHGGWYTRTPGPLVAGRPLVYVGKDSHGSYHNRREMAAFHHSCLHWDDIRSPNGTIPSTAPAAGASTDYWWTNKSPLVRLPKYKKLSTETWMKADRIGERWSTTDLTVSGWVWGPQISFWCTGPGCDLWHWNKEGAVGTHPTNRPADWVMASCKGNGGNTSKADGCSRNQAPLWAIGMGTLKAKKFVWSKRLGVKFTIDRVASLSISQTDNVRLFASLPKGFKWSVQSGAQCSINDRKLRCDLGQMPLADDGLQVRVHAKKRPGPYRAVVKATATWPDLQQVARAKLVFVKK